MKRIILSLAIVWALTACENESVSIPDSLNGTAWQATKEDGGHISLMFDAETYEMVQYAPYDGDADAPTDPDEEQPVETRTYRYAKPNVELSEDSETTLSGEIKTDGKSSLLMVLHNADNTVAHSFYKVK